MTWRDAEDIAIALVEAHPDVDPLTVRFSGRNVTRCTAMPTIP